MSDRPTAWREFVARAGTPPFASEKDAKRFAAFSRFAARYRVATSVKALEFDGMAPGTGDAYFAALRITLAYTALEALESALQARGNITLVDSDTAAHIRSDSYRKFRETLIESVSNSNGKAQRAALKALFDGDTDDLRPLVYAIRNLMCHGTLTAERLTLSTSKLRRDRLHNLADLVLEATDARFSVFVAKGKWK